MLPLHFSPEESQVSEERGLEGFQELASLALAKDSIHCRTFLSNAHLTSSYNFAKTGIPQLLLIVKSELPFPLEKFS